MHYNLRKRVDKNSQRPPLIKKKKDNNNSVSQNKNLTQKKIKLHNQNNNKASMAKLTASLDIILKSLPNFDGQNNTNIEYFTKQFDDLVKSDNAELSDEIRLILFRSKFSGKARDLIASTPELQEETDYENFKKLIAENFKRPKSFAQSQSTFMELAQNPDQSIDDYLKIFNIAAAQYLNDSGHAQDPGAKSFLDKIKLTKFTDSVRPEIAYEIRKADPNKFEDAIKIARRVEIALNASKESITNITLKQNKDREIKNSTANILYETVLNRANNHEEDLREIKAQLNKLTIDKQENYSNESPNTKYCHICKRPNHDTDNCWYNTKRKDRVNPYFNQTPIVRQNIEPNTNPMYNMPEFTNYAHQALQHNPNHRLSQNYGNITNLAAQANTPGQIFQNSFENAQYHQNSLPQAYNQRQANTPGQIFQNSFENAQYQQNSFPQDYNQRGNSRQFNSRGRFRGNNNQQRGYRNQSNITKRNTGRPQITYPQGN